MTSSELTDRLQRCQRVLAASRDGHWERDLRSGRVWYSDSFYALFGLQPGDPGLEHDQWRTRLHPDDQQRFREAYHTAVAECGSFDYEMRFLDGAGHWRWVRGRGQVWPDADGQPEFLSGACTDVHRERITLATLEDQSRSLEAQIHERTEALADALRRADERRAEAERANAAKSRYLAHISHEIRTPLSALMALNELALRGAHSADQQRFLAQARQSGEALQRTVSDVLDLARIESGRLELRTADFDLAQSLSDTLRALIPLAASRDLTLLFDHVGSELPVHGDASALRQIVNNLVGNAVRFTPKGQVRLAARVQPQGDGRLGIEINVADDGPGISPGRRATIFEPFVQGDPAPGQTERTPGSAGMGLAIAQGLAQAMDGRLSLHCPASGGAVFTLRLSLPPARSAQGMVQMPAPRHSTRGEAWLVYPNAGCGQWLERRLAREGWNCQLFTSLADALTASQAPGARLPDLLLLAETALQLATDLRPLRRALPDSVLHLVIRPDWHAPLLEAQARSMAIEPLVAPLTPAQLRALGPRRSGQALPQQPISKDLTPMAQDAREVLLVDDNEVNQLVGREFLQALGLRVRLAADGEQAMAACTEHPPALVLMDLQLPDMDGRQITERLNTMARDGQWPGAPIVALTAFATRDDEVLCQAAGMSGMLTKPLSLDMLRRELPRWLQAG